MYYRIQQLRLIEWKESQYRKPLIIRGARQVGKTTLVTDFAKQFNFFIPLNLEKSTDKEIFLKHDDVFTILKILYLRLNKIPQKNESVLIFIDEIQNSPEAVSLLRYFHEQLPDIFIIATGSLLESLMQRNISFPVGRVEYLFLHPFNFYEFLIAKSTDTLKSLYETVPLPDYGYSVLNECFKEYAFIGGMPEVVKTYLTTGQPVAVNPVYNNLILAYLDDVEKYANSEHQVKIIRFIIQNAFLKAGQRIKFEGFGDSNYKSRDVGDCFRLLEKTFLLRLLYPTTQMALPINEDRRKSPRLQVLDTGLMNKIMGIQTDILMSTSIDSIYEGRIAEHLVGQELLSVQTDLLTQPVFWIREKKQSSAEIDYVLIFKGMVIPIEVKSAKTGHLRSLFEFIDGAPHGYAIRIYSGELRVDVLKTIKGKPFKLLNLPIFLTCKINDYLEWFLTNY
jgi:uncharacterized protein